jgi:hypothetical protein
MEATIVVGKQLFDGQRVDLEPSAVAVDDDLPDRGCEAVW